MDAQFLISQFGEDGPALANSTTATSLLATGRSPKIPSSYHDRIAKSLLVEAWGRISNIVTTPGTLTLDVRLGSVVVWNGGAMNLNAVAKTNVPWHFRALLHCTVIGAGTTGKIKGIGDFQSEALIGAPLPTAGGNASLLLPVGNPADGTGFDTELDHQLRLFAAFSIANAGNSIQLVGGRVLVTF